MCPLGGAALEGGVNVGYFSPSYHQRGAALADIQRERGREKSNLHRNLNLGHFSQEEGADELGIIQ